MKNFYKPDYSLEPDSPFARDSQNKLIRKTYQKAKKNNKIVDN